MATDEGIISLGEDTVKPGNIILLNGTSSAGKTTLAKVLQKSMDEPYLHMGNDQFLQPNRPDNMLEYADKTSHTQVDGWLVVLQDGRFVELQIGAIALRWLTGMYRAMAAWSEAGNHLIADVVLHDERILHEATAIFHQLPVWFISVYCPLEISEKRERERTEKRALGGARLFYEGVYQNRIFDLMVDTSKSSSEECAQQIKQYMKSDNSPNAFLQLHQQFNHAT
jgi:chloramphenicol 3-O phosphotransferase